MFLDLAALRRRGGRQRYHFEESLKLPGVSGDAPRFLLPVTAEVEAVNTGAVILLNLEASTAACLECSCCLAPISYPLHLSLQLACVHRDDLAQLGIDPEDEREEYQIFDERPFNLGELVLENLLLLLPMKPLCRDECRGICPGCGQDLNEGQCRCQEPKIDPRLEVLRGLLGPTE